MCNLVSLDHCQPRQSRSLNILNLTTPSSTNASLITSECRRLTLLNIVVQSVHGGHSKYIVEGS